MNNQQKICKLWNDGSDEYFDKFEYDRLFALLKQDPYNGFPKAMAPVLRAYAPDLAGKRVLVPSCGDCVAVFGFCALGARVTAADLSENQIANARKVAGRYGIAVEFQHCDSMTLDALPDGAFDLVYTSNGVHVWIHDLCAMYRNIRRVLRDGGRYILFDTHPVCRPFESEPRGNALAVRKPYEDVGPAPDDPTLAWRTQDVVNALIDSGLTIERMEEFHSVADDFANHNYLYEKDDLLREKFDWRRNPWAALPQCLGLCCRKADG